MSVFSSEAPVRHELGNRLGRRAGRGIRPGARKDSRPRSDAVASTWKGQDILLAGLAEKVASGEFYWDVKYSAEF